MDIVEVIAASLSIIAMLYGFYRWSKSKLRKEKPSNIFVKEGNIYLTYANGDIKQITFIHSDISPVLGQSLVIFFRGEKINKSNSEYFRYKLVAIDVNSLKETIITDQKPFADGLTNSFEILEPRNLSISPDESNVVFIVEKYVTGSQLVQVNIKSGRWNELFSVEYFEKIASGKFKNQLLVGRSEVGEKGRGIYYTVCDHNGKTLLEFDDYENYMKFRSKAMIRE